MAKKGTRKKKKAKIKQVKIRIPVPPGGHAHGGKHGNKTYDRKKLKRELRNIEPLAFIIAKRLNLGYYIHI